MRRAGEGTSVPLALPGRRGGHLERCALAPVARPPWVGAALPQPRGSPLGGHRRQRRKSLQLSPGLRRAARGTWRSRLAEKPAAAAVCAKFWAERKAQRGPRRRAASCGQSRRATLGPPSRSRRRGQVAFAPPMPAEAGGRSAFNPSGSGKQVHPWRRPLDAGWLGSSRPPAQSGGLGACPRSFRVFCSFLFTCVQKPDKLGWGSSPSARPAPRPPSWALYCCLEK